VTSATAASYRRSCPDASQFNFHSKRQAMPDFEDTDLSDIAAPHVLEELGDL
jgi:hypothetical protein